jgi:hypothetical protein
LDLMAGLKYRFHGRRYPFAVKPRFPEVNAAEASNQDYPYHSNDSA